MKQEHKITFEKAKALLETNGYTLEWIEAMSYAFYHPNNPRQHILTIQVSDVLSQEMTKKVLKAVEHLNNENQTAQ